MATNPTIEHLLASTHRVMRQLTSAKAAPLGITSDQFRVLTALTMETPQSLGQLAHAVRLDNPSMSRIVRELEAQGLLTAVADPKHGRKLRIELARPGRSLMGTTGINEYFEAGRGLTPEESDTLAGLLGKYLQGLDAMAATDLDGVPLRASAA